MGKLPLDMKMTPHAQQRLAERKDELMKYNTKNLMRSSVKWWGKDDLIFDQALYRHACYTTRKSSQLAYITDGDIEVIYNRNTKTAITVLEVKEKFKPITQFIKPERLKQVELKKERKRMKNSMEEKEEVVACRDCGATGVRLLQKGENVGVCEACQRRIQNAKVRNKEYIPYLQLSKSERDRIDIMRNARTKKKEKKKELEKALNEDPAKNEIIVPDSETYYQSKAVQAPISTHVVSATPVSNMISDSLGDMDSFITILKNYGCEISTDNLKIMIDVLLSTNKLKYLLENITRMKNENMLSNFNDILTSTETKLQNEWEANGFQEADDIKFKGFLTWRRILREAIPFWNQFNFTEILPTSPTTAVPEVVTKSEEPKIKKYEVSTDSISTIYNTRRPFSRVFYAVDENTAYTMFKNWMAEKNFHEDPKKTIIKEIK